MMILWFLLLNNSHGLVAIPQSSQEQCEANVRYVNASHAPGLVGTYAVCIQGSGPEH